MHYVLTNYLYMLSKPVIPIVCGPALVRCGGVPPISIVGAKVAKIVVTFVLSAIFG